MPEEGDPEQRNPWAFIPFLYPYVEVFSNSVNAVHLAGLKKLCRSFEKEIWEARVGPGVCETVSVSNVYKTVAPLFLWRMELPVFGSTGCQDSII